MSKLNLKSPFKERQPTPVEVSWLRLVRASMRARHADNEAAHYDTRHINQVHEELHEAHDAHFHNLPTGIS